MNAKLDKKIRLAMGDNLIQWLKISRGLIRDKGRAQNPLCKLFIKNVDCEGCPIKNKTGQSSCVGTPYDHWVTHHIINHPNELQHMVNKRLGYRVECSECKELARDMFDFWLDILFEG